MITKVEVVKPVELKLGEKFTEVVEFEFTLIDGLVAFIKEVGGAWEFRWSLYAHSRLTPMTGRYNEELISMLEERFLPTINELKELDFEHRRSLITRYEEVI